jgi:2-polyprenyl-3-methyl-5-hydroxy-6-metoxy-1,4-benzoquinol methylase
MLKIKAIPGIKTKEELRKYVLKHGCYAPDENLRIYEKWFANAPRYLFRAVDKKYHITESILCDVGCSYGMNLFFCAPGSYGIDIDEYAIRFAKSLGLCVFQKDIVNDDISDLPKAEVIWCSAVLEHVDCPHIFLRKLHILLKPNGLLVLYVPTIPLLPFLAHLPKMGRYFSGHRAADHVNAFTIHTIRFFCERAGFQTIEVSPFLPGPLALFNKVPLLNSLIDGCVYIGRAIEGWEYPDKATRRATSTRKGFIIRSECP